MCREDSILQRLRRHPPDRQQALPAFPVVVGLIDVSGHAEVLEEKIIFISCSQTYTNYNSYQVSFVCMYICM